MLYQLCFYVPASHLEQVKSALFAAGAGRYMNYDQCAWQTLGQGQFRPLDNSRAYTGEVNKLKIVPEYKVEMICVAEKIQAALSALLTSHPYEQPAYSVCKIMTADNFDLPL